ncbi:MAG TPA: (E)-4-hydroxy-3-methylbut-2-enyl-diphosphate synthase [Candidatus Dormibacteraeota bacterium]|nr:(E)-4-hydroxy-3-methylbut-2-enyl-diphosphate synthase [Candidatus Dormibacteraeota bacterium]
MIDLTALPRNPTRAVRIGRTTIGSGHAVAVQSMCATRTSDVEATVRQILDLERAGADIVRIAVDSARDVAALRPIRERTGANLSVDLQENYRLASEVAPFVDKIRYNPGHLHHHERTRPVRDKVAFLAEVAAKHDCAVRVGVNCGSIDPDKAGRFAGDSVAEMVESALEHAALLDDLGFTRYCVSLKDSEPKKVIDANVRFAEVRKDVPLHLGVTEAGLPPEGVIKTRVAFEQLLSRGIGDTIRVSLTVPNDRKGEEIAAGRSILEDIARGRFRSVPENLGGKLNIISCPSCSRVENEAFVELAEKVREVTAYAREHAITIAVMGCRVNGPGETDDADLGLWCAPTHVNLKAKAETIGTYRYDEVLARLKTELDRLVASRGTGG